MNGPKLWPRAMPFAQAGIARGFATVVPSALCVNPSTPVAGCAGAATGLAPTGRDATASSRSCGVLPAARLAASAARARSRSPAATEGADFHPDVNAVRPEVTCPFTRPLPRFQ